MTTPPKDWFPPFMKVNFKIDFDITINKENVDVLIVLAEDLTGDRHIFSIYDGDEVLEEKIKESSWYKIALLWKKGFSKEDIEFIGNSFITNASVA